MTVSKDGIAMMYLLVEENFDKLAEETSIPRETWENSAKYDASMGLPTSKVYVVPREPETPWRQMVGEVIYDIDKNEDKLIVWPEETPEMAALLLGQYGTSHERHYLLLDVTLSTDVEV